MISVPVESGTACKIPLVCSWAFAQKAISEPWNNWMVLERPTALFSAVPSLYPLSKRPKISSLELLVLISG